MVKKIDMARVIVQVVSGEKNLPDENSPDVKIFEQMRKSDLENLYQAATKILLERQKKRKIHKSTEENSDEK